MMMLILRKMRRFGIFILIALCLVVVSCTSSRPDYVLDEDDMEELLYDIHKAHFIDNDNYDLRTDGGRQYAMFLSVLKKHDVTRAEWDSSLVYYCIHADQLDKIYASLTERLEYEASSMGASMGDARDSTNIWSEEKNILLMGSAPYTTRQWTLNTDSLLKPGEKVMMNFIALYVSENVEKRATAVLCMRLANDSIIERHQTITSTGRYSLEIALTDSLPIKSLMGVFMMHQPQYADESSAMSNSTQVLCIENISLTHELPASVHKNAGDESAPDHPMPPGVSREVLDENPKPLDDKPRRIQDGAPLTLQKQ